MNKITIDYEYYKDLLKKEDLLTELEEWLKGQFEIMEYKIGDDK